MLAAVCCFALAMQQEPIPSTTQQEPLPAVKAKPTVDQPAEKDDTEVAAPPVVPRKVEPALPPVKALRPHPAAPLADTMPPPPAPRADTAPPLPPAPVPETDDPRRGMAILAAIALAGVGLFVMLIRRRSEPIDARAIESPGSDASPQHSPSSPDHSRRDEDARDLRR
jgi:hypothetical protein